jgi:pimeloyl-ACP methyl ester carboxylesterase
VCWVHRYTKPLQAENWDRGLWEFMLASRSVGLDKQLDRIRVPVLVITGDDDRIVPTAQSVRLAGELPNAKLVIVPNCGHIPQEESPAAFLQAVADFLTTLP